MLASKRVLVCLTTAWCVWPATAGAQPTAAPDGTVGPAPATGVNAYSCVDPTDGSARRRYQDVPCRWPLYQLPAPASGEPLVLPSYPQPPPGAQAGHAMFWRFPVQPMGPHDAPRHGR